MEQLPSMLKALGEPTRLTILQFLAASGPDGLTPGVLERAMNKRSSLVGHHTNELLAAGVLSQQKSGRYVIYRVKPEALQMIILALTNLYSQSLGQTKGATDAADRPSPAGAA